MSNWSYKVVEIKPNFMGSFKPPEVEEELSRHGRAGWELVSFMQGPMTPALAIFKKEQP
ncbi:MAG TPA: DUF4177 domain-containing protein [Luteimonas sp.]|nr:DUF4177 domain-containing protein [Luteimonas sp.]